MSEGYSANTLHAAGTASDADPLRNRVSITFTSRGTDIHIPSTRHMWSSALSFVFSSVNKVSATLYPIPLSAVVLASTGLCVYVHRAPANAPILTNPVAHWLLYFDSLLPLSIVPPRFRAASVVAKTSVALLGAVTVVNRFILRRLLRYQGWMLERNPAKPSLVTRLWAITLKTFFTRKNIRNMDAYEGCLPVQPLPSLSSTVAHYLDSMRGVLSLPGADREDWIELRRTAEAFLLSEGPSLQRALRLHHVISKNYVTDWYTRNAFLATRQGLCGRSNYYTIPFAAFQPTPLQAARAAVITFNLVKLQRRVAKRDLMPNFTGPCDCVPVTMSQFPKAFNTTRIPGRDVDTLEHHPGEDYIVVLHRGQIFKMLVLHPRSRRQLTPRQLETLFSSILDNVAETLGGGSGTSTGLDDESEEDMWTPSSSTAVVGTDSSPSAMTAAEKEAKRRSYRVAETLLPALTTAPRAEWADVRNNFLLNDASNHYPLRTIEKALFVVSLDDVSSSEGFGSVSPGKGGGLVPLAQEELSRECKSYLCGNGVNLWCDKSFNLVVRSDARVGVHVEHSWGDLPNFLSLFEYVTAMEETQTQYDEDGHARELREDRKALSPQIMEQIEPRRLRFSIHKNLAKSIRAAHTKFLEEVASQLDVHVLRFSSYGRAVPDALGVDPDAWVQMAIQLAYYRHRGKYMSQIYESVPLSTFARGRTDAVRAVTADSLAFVLAMTEDDDAATATAESGTGTRRSQEEKLALLRKACETHQSMVQRVRTGQGVDQHLIALCLTSAAKEVPSEFLSLVQRKTKWRVSTAQVQQRYLSGRQHSIQDVRPFETPACGFGPISHDGYGVSYCYCGNGLVYVTVTSMKGSEQSVPAQVLAQSIDDALERMMDISGIAPGSLNLDKTIADVAAIPELARSIALTKRRHSEYLSH